MEVILRFLGFLLRILALLLSPWLWLRSRRYDFPVPAPSDPILLLDVQELADSIRSGKLSSVAVVKAYIDRIREVDPLINAVVDDRFEEALQEAREVDDLLEEIRRTGQWDLIKDKPLLGVPFTVKESCLVKGLSNAVGCPGRGGTAARDGGAVRAARRAGALPLLVSRTPALCLGWETDAGAAGGLRAHTNNPYCLARSAGGSSGGEAALAGAAASPWGVCSDIAGSTRLPAALCGVPAIKPTPGIVSIEGHIPTFDDENFPQYLAVGAMARRARDLPLLLKVLAEDRAPLLRLDEPVDLSALTIYYMTEAGHSIALEPTHKDIKDAILKSVRMLRDDHGCKISEKKFKDFDDSMEISISVFFEMKGIPSLLQDPLDPKKEKSLVWELIKTVFGYGTVPVQSMIFTVIQRTKLFIPKFRRDHYRRKAERLREDIISTLGGSGVLLCPVYPRPAPRHGALCLGAAGAVHVVPHNVLGLPAATVPAGLAESTALPTAVQVIAAPYQDRLCLEVAKKIELAFGGWTFPTQTN